MKRRNFLTTVAAVAVAPAIPEFSAAAVTTVSSPRGTTSAYTVYGIDETGRKVVKHLEAKDAHETRWLQIEKIVYPTRVEKFGFALNSQTAS